MRNPLKINILMLTMLLSLLFISCSNSDESKEFQENSEKLDMTFMYETSFMDEYNVNQIEVELNTDGDTIYTLYFDQDLNIKAMVLPGKDIDCEDRECIGKEMKECLDNGGKKVTLTMKKESGHMNVECE